MSRKIIVLAWISLGIATVAHAQSPATPERPSADPVAIVNGARVIAGSEVDSAAGRDIYILQERLYLLRKKALDDLIDKALLEQEAAARGISLEELERRVILDKVQITDAQVDKEYTEHGSAIALAHAIGTVEETKRLIRADLERGAKIELYKALIAQLRAKARIELLPGAPEPPLARLNDSGPSIGPKQAPVTVIEFSDFQCPYCKESRTTLEQLAKTYGSKVRVVFKQLPLLVHPRALKAAEASMCADAQGKFWPYHDKLFSSDDLSDAALNSYADAIGLNRQDFDKCLASPATVDVIRKDVEEARDTDIHTTPSFVVNGRVLSGFTELPALQQEIDLQLKRLDSGKQ
jgi:protein-disulfide isomerase